MTKDEAYFTYAHARKSDGRIFYIGKGKHGRATSKADRNNYWHNTVAKHGLEINVLAKWRSEQEAFEHEKFLIWCFRDMGFGLVNMTDGGEGLANPSQETRSKMSQNNAMKRPEVAAKISAARKGKPLSDEHCLKLSEVQSGRKLSEATRQKMRNRYLTAIPEATKQKMADSAKKAWAKRKEKNGGVV
jgi:hypothetical protein